MNSSRWPPPGAEPERSATCLAEIRKRFVHERDEAAGTIEVQLESLADLLLGLALIGSVRAQLE
jgi:hypothetical protein